MIFISKTNIICKRCGKAATIQSEKGSLCLICWREVRKENRLAKQQDALAKCFSYRIQPKLTGREAEIINDIMCELENRNSKNPKGL